MTLSGSINFISKKLNEEHKKTITYFFFHIYYFLLFPLIAFQLAQGITDFIGLHNLNFHIRTVIMNTFTIYTSDSKLKILLFIT